MVTFYTKCRNLIVIVFLREYSHQPLASTNGILTLAIPCTIRNPSWTLPSTGWLIGASKLDVNVVFTSFLTSPKQDTDNFMTTKIVRPFLTFTSWQLAAAQNWPIYHPKKLIFSSPRWRRPTFDSFFPAKKVFFTTELKRPSFEFIRWPVLEFSSWVHTYIHSKDSKSSCIESRDGQGRLGFRYYLELTGQLQGLSVLVLVY